MKKYLFLFFVFCIYSNLYAANVIAKKSPITKVTIFKDRAFVTRRQYVTIKEGNFSIKFEEMTPLLDKESIKVRVSNPQELEILGVRTKKIFLKKSQDKELLKLRKNKEELSKKIREITLNVENLIKEHKDLRILANHYNESFTLNLHTQKWSKDKFRSFLNFVGTRSKGMHSKWKKSFLTYIKIYDELQFTNNKIAQLYSVSELEKLDVFVDVSIPAPTTKAWIEIQYLVTNVGWKPIYDIRIDGRNNKASILQHASIWQRTGEDWNKVKIRLSNVRSELTPQVPSISSYTLSYKEVKKVKTTIKNKMVDVKNLSQGSATDEELEGMAKYFDIKGRQTLVDGMPATKIFIQEKDSKYQEHLELVSNQFSHVYKKGEMKNTFPFTLASGPLGIYYNNEFIQNTTLQTIVPGKSFYLNTGIEHAVTVSRWHQNKNSKKGIINQNKEYKREFITSLKNYSKRSMKVKVLEQIPMSELETIQISSEGSTAGLKAIKESPSWHYWDIVLKPREQKRLNLTLKVETPKDFQFNWPQ